MLRIIMFGTGPFAVPVFEALLESDHEVPALVTRPIEDAGKRRKSAANPTRDAGQGFADQNAGALQILDPQDVNDSAIVRSLQDFAADLFVVCDYGQILSSDCLSAARLGGINLHGSLLPAYRGAAPIQWSVYNGDNVTGVTVIHMSPKLDAGNCLTTAEMKIGKDQTAGELEPELSAMGVEPVFRAIEMLQHWDGSSAIGTPQDRKLATKAPRLKKSDGLIDWTRSAGQIRNQIRAFQPWPGSFAIWNYALRGKQKELRLIIHSATVIDDGFEPLSPGQVVSSQDNRLVIQTGSGFLALDAVQPAGKSKMAIEEFLRGRQPEVGDWFCSPV